MTISSPEITDWSQSLMLHFTLIVQSQTWKTFQQKYQIFSISKNLNSKYRFFAFDDIALT
jgi:hypothetical protein